MAALMTADYLQERAKRGTRKKFEAVLAKVPDTEPEAIDRLPIRRLKRTGKKRRSSAAKH